VEQLLIFLVTGAAAGVLAGLFGVGGGLIMVPALALVLPLQGFSDAVYMQSAIGTSLAVIAMTSISSTLAHQRRGGVLWPVFWRFAAGLAIGALLGAWVADQLSGNALKRIVGFGALAVSLQMFYTSLRPKPNTATGAGTVKAGTVELVGVGGIIGALSSLIGIGGGSLTVPYLSGRGVSMHQAVGTSAACGVPIAWAGAAGFMLTGLDSAALPGWHIGYISLGAFAGMALASVATAPLGVKLAHRLPPHLLKRAFALLLLVVGLRMLLG
jgi:uncharacterized membrane protein YfcA